MTKSHIILSAAALTMLAGAAVAPSAHASHCQSQYLSQAHPPRGALQAVDDRFIAQPGQSVTVVPMANDLRPAGGTAPVIISTGTPSLGTAAVRRDNRSITYLSYAPRGSQDEFTYTIRKGTVTRTATIRVLIGHVPDDTGAQTHTKFVATGRQRLMLDRSFTTATGRLVNAYSDSMDATFGTLKINADGTELLFDSLGVNDTQGVIVSEFGPSGVAANVIMITVGPCTPH